MPHEARRTLTKGDRRTVRRSIGNDPRRSGSLPLFRRDCAACLVTRFFSLYPSRPFPSDNFYSCPSLPFPSVHIRHSRSSFTLTRSPPSPSFFSLTLSLPFSRTFSPPSLTFLVSQSSDVNDRSRGLLVTETTATVEGEFTHGAASRRRWQWWRRWRRRRRGWWRRWHCPSSSRRTWWGTQKRNHHRLYHSPYISLRFRMPYDIPHTPLVFFWSAARPPIADGHKGSTVGSFNSDLRTVGCRS